MTAPFPGIVQALHKSVGIKPVSFMNLNLPLNEMVQSWKCFLHVIKIPTLTYNRVKSGIIKIAIILKIIPNIFKLRDTFIYIAISADNINMTQISSCVIGKCYSNEAKFIPYYTNCNETADAFFCKQGIFYLMITQTDIHINTLCLCHNGSVRFNVYMTKFSIFVNLDDTKLSAHDTFLE